MVSQICLARGLNVRHTTYSHGTRDTASYQTNQSRRKLGLIFFRQNDRLGLILRAVAIASDLICYK